MTSRVKRYCPRCGGTHGKDEKGCNATKTYRYCPVCKNTHSNKRKCEAKPDYHKLYKTAWWQKSRRAVLQETPFCVVCGAPADTVDHIRPHRGNTERFYDHNNLQSMCCGCHSDKTGRGL